MTKEYFTKTLQQYLMVFNSCVNLFVITSFVYKNIIKIKKKKQPSATSLFFHYKLIILKMVLKNHGHFGTGEKEASQISTESLNCIRI